MNGSQQIVHFNRLYRYESRVGEFRAPLMTNKQSNSFENSIKRVESINNTESSMLLESNSAFFSVDWYMAALDNNSRRRAETASNFDLWRANFEEDRRELIRLRTNNINNVIESVINDTANHILIPVIPELTMENSIDEAITRVIENNYSIFI